ncbi:hypothetical protein F5B17DRAFT_425929 [Nemania serpens]|nr:hypothetical protein F5B17DRAFT_425929 [Nemania serpens]
MASYGTGRAFAQRVDAQLKRIECVLPNAGLIWLQFTTVPSTGHEEGLQVRADTRGQGPKPRCKSSTAIFDDAKTFDAQEHYHSKKLLAHMFLWKLVGYMTAEDVVVILAEPA